MSIIFGNLYPGGITTMGLNTADNGLTANTATNVQLGGTLIKDTSVDPAAFQLLLGVLGLTATKATSSATPTNPTDLVRLQDIVPIVASFKGSVNAVGVNTLYSYVAATTGLYRLSFAIVCDSAAGGNGDLDYSYTDENNQFHLIDLGTISAPGAPNIVTACVYAKAGTSITHDLTIAGAINFHVASTVEFLK